jgi:hypothetical protein
MSDGRLVTGGIPEAFLRSLTCSEFVKIGRAEVKKSG